jgi:hypothetical protein
MGPFLDRKWFFPMESLKNLQIFNIQACSQHISPYFWFLHMLCKKIAQTAVFATFYELFISRFCKKFLLVYI